jgi:hypothetical protein
MISMNVRLQNPLNLQVQSLHTFYKTVCAGGAGSAGFWVVIENTVDQGTLSSGQIGQEMAKGEGSRIKKRLNVHFA